MRNFAAHAKIRASGESSLSLQSCTCGTRKGTCKNKASWLVLKSVLELWCVQPLEDPGSVAAMSAARHWRVQQLEVTSMV